MAYQEYLQAANAALTRHTRLIRLGARPAFWGCVVVVTYLALTPSSASPGFSWDKANHLLAFVVLAGLAELGWPARRHAPWRYGLLLAYGLFIETVQQFLPLRQFSWLDLLADAFGLLLYFVLKQVVAAIWRKGRASGSTASPG